LYLCTLVQKAGFPPGTLNVLSGFGKTTGAAIVRHPGIDKIAFTGSTAVGKEIVRSAGLKKVTLELGGKSPAIVFEDADIEQAVKWSHNGMYFNHNELADDRFYNQGQVCCANTRIYVHESINDKFTKAFAEFTRSNKVGNPFDEDTYQGPQISKVQFDRVNNYIKLGKKEGAKVLIGEEPTSSENGFFIQPHIFTDVKPEMTVHSHFGIILDVDCSRGDFRTCLCHHDI
jgi:aldehyde dehydrogenase (NAD+)